MREIFHSLHRGNLGDMRDEQVETRTRRLRVGHTAEIEKHERNGCKGFSEKRATVLTPLPSNPELDYSISMDRTSTL